MLHTKPDITSRMSIKIQIAIISSVLAGLVAAPFTLYDFMIYLGLLKGGDPFALSLLVSIMVTGYVLLHKLGFDFSYKEEIELPAHRENHFDGIS
jgi:hypothetical protein